MLLYCSDDLYHKRGIITYISYYFNHSFSSKAYYDKTNDTYMIKVYMHHLSRNQQYFLFQR